MAFGQIRCHRCGDLPVNRATKNKMIWYEGGLFHEFCLQNYLIYHLDVARATAIMKTLVRPKRVSERASTPHI